MLTDFGIRHAQGQQQRVNGVPRLSHVEESGSARNNGLNRPEHVGENNLRRALDD
jgi:hypothetical protein